MQALLAKNTHPNSLLPIPSLVQHAVCLRHPCPCWAEEPAELRSQRAAMTVASHLPNNQVSCLAYIYMSINIAINTFFTYISLYIFTTFIHPVKFQSALQVEFKNKTFKISYEVLRRWKYLAKRMLSIKYTVIFLCNKCLLVSSELHKTIGGEWQCCHLYNLLQFSNRKLFFLCQLIPDNVNDSL